jgi:hypothetical protein
MKLSRFQETDQDKARMKIVEATELLLKMINEDPGLRPCLKEYPFTSEHLKICLNFCNRKYTPYHGGKIERVTLENNQLTYYHDLPNEGNIVRMEEPVFAEEPYSQALEYYKEHPTTWWERFVDWWHERDWLWYLQVKIIEFFFIR